MGGIELSNMDLTFCFEVIIDSNGFVKLVQRDPVYPSLSFPQMLYLS